MFLPPANEVWGKVIFLHLFVILFTGEVPGPGGVPGARGVPGPGGAWSRGVPGPSGCLEETPPEQLLLWVVRILLECILVTPVCLSTGGSILRGVLFLAEGAVLSRGCHP